MMDIKSVSLDNILHPYEDDPCFCDDDDVIIVKIKNIICYMTSFGDVNQDITKERGFQKNIKIKHYIKSGEICPICLENIWTIRNAYLTECGHGFHYTCINKHYNIMEDAQCPMCRHNIESPDESHIFKYNTKNYHDKLDDFWFNIDKLNPKKCENDYEDDLEDHYKGMNDFCSRCWVYRKFGR